MRPSTRQIRRIGIRYGVTYRGLLEGRADVRSESKRLSSLKTTKTWDGWPNWREELARTTSFLNHIPKLRFHSFSGEILTIEECKKHWPNMRVNIQEEDLKS